MLRLFGIQECPLRSDRITFSRYGLRTRTLLRAKKAAEDIGFEVLHMYVDGLWIKKEGLNKPEHFQEILEAIKGKTGIPIALDGVYKWIVFLPSKVDFRVPVPNRYFVVFQSGEIKVRGIEGAGKINRL